MSKLRVYELAKDYGMKGPELAKLLRELGFGDVVKTHMAVLDEPLQMMIQARLEASGVKLVKDLPADAAPAELEADAHGHAHAHELEGGKKLLKKLVPKPAGPPSLPPLVKRKELTPARPEPTEPRVEPTREETVARAHPESVTLVPTVATPPVILPEPPRPVAEPVTPPTGSHRENRRENHREPPREPEPEVAAEPVAETTPEPEATPVASDATGPVAEATPETAASAPGTEAGTPVDATEPPGTGPTAPPTTTTPPGAEVPGKEVKRLRLPEPRAKVLGKIQLSSETIRDAGQRSAPAGERNPSKVDPNLRRQLMDRLRTRGSGPGRPDPRRGQQPGGAGQRPGQRRPGERGAMPMRGPKGSSQSSVDLSKIIQIEPPVSVKKLSESLGIKVGELLGILMKLGVKGVNINSFLDKDQVELVAIEKGRKVEIVEQTEAEDQLLTELGAAEEEGESLTRPPIVTFMGHVDHGKTSLLDAIRRSDVAGGEAGGITQHIGAYKVTTAEGKQVVILDTPGHAAFTAMRAHGARLTDVVVLVVAADDGVMPQTEEAINHAKAAAVPIVVAINKCDKPQANPLKVRQQLSALGLQPEEWGGDVQMVEVSAITSKGLPELIEKIELQAYVMDLKANPAGLAKGTVVEAKQTAGQGNIVTLLVMDGTLHKGDFVLCGNAAGRIRGLIDDHGNAVDDAGPGTPVEVIGLPELPLPGDKFYAVDDEKKAKEVAEVRVRKAREKSLAERQGITLETLSARLAAKDIEEVRIILKADVVGSLEPIRKSLQDLSTKEVKVNLLHTGLGAITETDVALADASKAVIAGFNTVPDDTARQAAEQKGVQIRFYSIIYELIDDVKKAMEGLLAPEEREVVLGHAEVRAVFRASKLGNIAGCFVTDGLINRKAKVRLIRDSVVIYTGKLASLRRIKDDVGEVKSGFECGARIENYEDIKEGDRLECFDVKLEKRSLEA